MTDDLELRDKDRAVLQAIEKGHNDTQKITQHTTLENHHVRYSLKKLEKQGLIHLEKPDGMTERIVNGQKRVFQTPLQAQATEKGLEKIEQLNQEDLEAHQDMSHRELVKKQREIEEKLEQLEHSIEAFKHQIQKKLK